MRNEKEPVVVDDPMDLILLFTNFKKNWFWFVLSIPFCLFLAHRYNAGTREFHTLEAKLLIHVNEDRLVYSEDAISGMNSMTRAKTVENEIAVLTSRDLIQRALDSLNANVSYYRPEPSLPEVSWESLPIAVNADFKWANKVSDVPFRIEFLDNGSFHVNASEEEDLGTFEMGDVIEYNGFLFSLNKREGALLNNLPKDPILFYVNSNESIVRHFSNNLTIHESDRDTDAITLSLTETLKERGIEFLSELLEVYVTQLEEDRKRIAQHTYDFIEERIMLNFGTLDSLEFAIDDYKVKREISLPSIEGQYILEAIKKFEIELNDAETQKDIVDELVDKVLRNPRQEMDLSVPVTMLGVNDPLLNDMIVDLNRKQYKLKTISKTVHKDNPLFLEMKAELDDLRSSVMVDLLNLQENMNTTVSYISNQIMDYKRQLAIMNVNGKELASMERLKDNKEELYVYLLKKREEAAIILASELMDTWVLERPRAVSSFHEPKKSIVYAIGLFLGVFVPSTFILIWMLFDTKLRSTSAIRKVIRKPVLAEIGHSHLANGTRLQGHQEDIRNEDYRNLMFNVMHKKPSLQTMMIGSMRKGEGKSSTAVNLAKAMGSIGKKTLLIDLDLRFSGLNKEFGIQDSMHGILDVLNGNLALEDVLIAQSPECEFDMLPSGRLGHDPSRILSPEKMSPFIASLKEKYDFILIDTPPLIAVTDTYMIAALVDMNLILTREGHTDKRTLNRLSEVLASGRLENVEVVFNGSTSILREREYVLGIEPQSVAYRIRTAITNLLSSPFAIGKNS